MDSAPQNKSNDNKINKEIIASFVVQSEKSNFINMQYWVSNSELVNGIKAGTTFMCEKDSGLDNNSIFSLTEVHGAKEFTTMEDVRGMFFYLYTSKDRLITAHNLQTFCKIELGEWINDVVIKLIGVISPKPQEGIISAVNVQLIPSESGLLFLKQKGVLKDLLVRMKKRSADDVNYRLSILQPDKANE